MKKAWKWFWVGCEALIALCVVFNFPVKSDFTDYLLAFCIVIDLFIAIRYRK